MEQDHSAGPTRILVAAASKYGATQEIADAIGGVLAATGAQVDVKPVEEVSNLAGYDALVLGSGVYMGNWLESARRFVSEHREEIAARPTWLFSSGTVGDPPVPSRDRAVQTGPLLSQTKAKEHRLFGGRLEKARLSTSEVAMISTVHAEMGDFRDWEEIEAWATEIARALQA